MEKRSAAIITFDGPAIEAKQTKKDFQTNTFADVPANIGISDINMKGYFTPELRNYLPVTAANAAGYYTTLSVVDPTSFGGSEGYPVFDSNQNTIMGRTGDGAVSMSYIKPGTNPIGWRNPGKKKVQKREKVVYNVNNPDVYFSWRAKARWEDLDYLLQPDERLDGGFMPGNARAIPRYDLASNDPNTTDIDLGSTTNKWSPTVIGDPQLYGESFPVGDKGYPIFSPKIYDDDAWSGAIIQTDPDDKYQFQVESVDPTSVTLGDPFSFVVNVTFTPGNEANFQTIVHGLQFDEVTPLFNVYVGPFLVTQYADGQYGWSSAASGTGSVIGNLTVPSDGDAGTYDVVVIGPTGVVVTLKEAVTVTKPDVDWNKVVEGQSSGA